MWNNFLTKIVKYLTLFDVKWNSPPHICEANISQRSYFTWRSQISLAARRISLKKDQLTSELVFFLAGAQGFEPRKCQSQSLMPYRLAMPHRNMIYYNHFAPLCQVVFEKNLKFFWLFCSITPGSQSNVAIFRSSTPLCRAYWQVYPVPPLVRRQYATHTSLPSTIRRSRSSMQKRVYLSLIYRTRSACERI